MVRGARLCEHAGLLVKHPQSAARAVAYRGEDRGPATRYHGIENLTKDIKLERVALVLNNLCKRQQQARALHRAAE